MVTATGKRTKGEEMNIQIANMTEAQAKQVLSDIIEKLDDLDGEDFFGTEGWKKYLGFNND
jgi:hypothetical protein